MGTHIRLQPNDAPGLERLCPWRRGVTRDRERAHHGRFLTSIGSQRHGRHLKETCTTGKPGDVRPSSDRLKSGTRLDCRLVRRAIRHPRRRQYRVRRSASTEQVRMPLLGGTDFCRSCDILSPRPATWLSERSDSELGPPGSGVIPPSLGSTAERRVERVGGWNR